MSGTSKGVKNSWATRRAMYGPSGRKPKNETSATRHEKNPPASSRNTNRAQRMNAPRDLPYNPELERAKREREDVLKEIRKFDRDKRTGKYPDKGESQYKRYNPAEPPKWAVDRSNELRAKRHQENVQRLRELDDYIKRMTAWLVAQERKKYGRRYK